MLRLILRRTAGLKTPPGRAFQRRSRLHRGKRLTQLIRFGSSVPDARNDLDTDLETYASSALWNVPIIRTVTGVASDKHHVSSKAGSGRRAAGLTLQCRLVRLAAAAQINNERTGKRFADRAAYRLVGAAQ